MIRALAITVSNRASAGVYADTSGPVLAAPSSAASFTAPGLTPPVFDAPVVPSHVPPPVVSLLRRLAGCAPFLPPKVAHGDTQLLPQLPYRRLHLVADLVSKMAGRLGSAYLEIAKLVTVRLELRPARFGEAVDLAAFGLLVLDQTLLLEGSEARIDGAR